MRTGLLNETITVQQLTKSVDSTYGTAEQTWTDFITSLRARVEFATGNRDAVNYEQFDSQSFKFTTHYRPSIVRGMRVVYRGDNYYINSVNHDRMNAKTVIMTEVYNE